ATGRSGPWSGQPASSSCSRRSPPDATDALTKQTMPAISGSTRARPAGDVRHAGPVLRGHGGLLLQRGADSARPISSGRSKTPTADDQTELQPDAPEARSAWR